MRYNVCIFVKAVGDARVRIASVSKYFCSILIVELWKNIHKTLDNAEVI